MPEPEYQKRMRSKNRTRPTILQVLLLVIGASNYVAGLHDQTPRIWGLNKPPAFAQLGSTTSQREQISPSGTRVAFEQSNLVLREETMLQHPISQEAIPGKSTMPPQIIIIGGPASGKGTQCEKIAERYGVVHLSTGDMLREAVKAGTHVGRIAKGYMERGELVPDDIIIAIVDARLKRRDCVERGWLLDGFPRTKAQAGHLVNAGIHADIALFLNVEDDELVERVVGRRTDPVNGKIYHLKFRPPPPEVVERLEQRSDDTKDSIAVRLKQFHSNVAQIKSYLEESLVTINGHGSPDAVARRVGKWIDRKLRQKESGFVRDLAFQ